MSMKCTETTGFLIPGARAAEIGALQIKLQQGVREVQALYPAAATAMSEARALLDSLRSATFYVPLPRQHDVEVVHPMDASTDGGHRS